jgi:hypothetical protein
LGKWLYPERSEGSAFFTGEAKDLLFSLVKRRICFFPGEAKDLLFSLVKRRICFFIPSFCQKKQILRFAQDKTELYLRISLMIRWR